MERIKLVSVTERSLAFGKLVAGLRAEKGWTQGQLALKLGKTKAYVTRLEQGQYENPGSETIAILAKEFGRSEIYFLEALGKRVAREPASAELEEFDLWLKSVEPTAEEIRQLRDVAQVLLKRNLPPTG